MENIFVLFQSQQPGGESGSYSVLDVMGKQLSPLVGKFLGEVELCPFDVVSIFIFSELLMLKSYYFFHFISCLLRLWPAQ